MIKVHSLPQEADLKCSTAVPPVKVKKPWDIVISFFTINRSNLKSGLRQSGFHSSVHVCLEFRRKT